MMNIKKYLINKKMYWVAKDKTKKFIFNYNKFKHIVNQKIMDYRDYSKEFFNFFKMSIWKLFLAISIIFILEYIETQFSINNFWPKVWKKYKGENFTTLYFSIATIITTLATIYFATISIVISTSYKNFSYEIRRLIWRDKDNSFYLDYLLSLIIFSFILAGINYFGFKTGSIVLLVDGFLCLLGIYALIHVSIKLFDLFSPVNILQYYIIPDIENLITQATVCSFQWNVAEVQYLHRNNVLKRLNILDEMTFKCFKTPENKVSDSEVLKLLYRILLLLCFYTSQKQKIPTDSKWYANVLKHKKWFTAGAGEIEVALSSQYNLMPYEEPDYLWFEKKIVSVIHKIMEEDFSTRDLSYKISISNHFDHAFEYIATIGEISLAKLIMEEIMPIFISSIEMLDINYENINDMQIEKKIVTPLALADVISKLSVTIILFICKSTANLKIEELINNINNMQWDDVKNIYNLEIPFELKVYLLNVRKKLIFEINVEGERVTPDWYISQLVCIELLKCLKLIPDHGLMFVKNIMNNINTYIDNPLICMQMIDRGIEACEKYQLLIDAIENQQEKLSEYIKSVKIETIDIIFYKKELNNLRKEIVKQFAKLGSISVTFPDHSQIPDYMGRAYWFISIECFHALINNDHDLFSQIFPPFFLNAFMIYNKFSKKASSQYWLAQNASILISIFALSGYALILKELSEGECWKTVDQVWNNLKKKDPDAFENQVQTVSNIVALSRQAGLFSNADYVHLMWQSQFRRILTKNKIVKNRDDFSSGINRGKKNKFENILLQILSETVSDVSWFYEPELLFLYFYLNSVLVDNEFVVHGEKYNSIVRRANRLKNRDSL